MIHAPLNNGDDMFAGRFRMDYERQNEAGVSTYYLQTCVPGFDPLHFITREGVIMRPASLLHDYDEGSVPRGICQGFVSPNAFGRAYAMHDMAYPARGWWELRGWTLWFNVDTGQWEAKGGTWVYVPKTRHEADSMLIRWAMADGCGRDEAYEMFEGVLLGGGGIWEAHAGPFPELPFIEGDVP